MVKDHRDQNEIEELHKQCHAHLWHDQTATGDVQASPAIREHEGVKLVMRASTSPTQDVRSKTHREPLPFLGLVAASTTIGGNGVRRHADSRQSGYPDYMTGVHGSNGACRKWL